MLFLGAVGWGLLTVGAISHLWHRDRLVELMGRHVDRSRTAAHALISAELALAAFVPAGFAAGWPLPAFATAALGLGFVAWVTRLRTSGSELPCACSFTDAPTSWWSVARAAGVVLTAAVAFAERGTGAEDVATFAVGLAVGSALFVLPDALAWPRAARAGMERIEAHGAQATT